MSLPVIDIDEEGQVEVRISPHYFVLKFGNREYYWDRDSGEYDGSAIFYDAE